MPETRIVITNLAEFKAQLDKLPKKIKATLSAKALKRGANHMRDVIKLHAPVDEGALEAGITARKSKDGMVVGIIKRQMPKGRWLEYGTSRMEPHPFFWNAAASAWTETEEMIKQDAAAILDKMKAGIL